MSQRVFCVGVFVCVGLIARAESGAELWPVVRTSAVLMGYADEGDQFGSSIAATESTVVVGANLEDSDARGVNGDFANDRSTDSGAAHVFMRNGANWVHQAYLKASNTRAGYSADSFGWSAAISGETIVIGALLERSSATGVNGDQFNTEAVSSGAAYVFVRDGTNWVQQAYLKASNTEANDRFTHSVAISGDTIIVGAPGEDSGANQVDGDQFNNDLPDAGAAYIFVRDGTNWTQQAYLKASNSDFSDSFGWKVGISGDIAIVGAREEDSNARGVNRDGLNNDAENSGAAYIFVRNGGVWTQEAYLKASNSEAGDDFGIDVAISGTTAIVGAMKEDSSASGVNGSTTSNLSRDSGAAYVFVRSGTRWVQQAYLKASNPGVDDRFGSALTIDGDTVVVGASYESSSSALGNDDNLRYSGAAYMFVRNGTNWTQNHFLKAPSPSSGNRFGYAVAVAGRTLGVSSIAARLPQAHIFRGEPLSLRVTLSGGAEPRHWISFDAQGGKTYWLDRATNLPASWENILTVMPSRTSGYEHQDLTAPAKRAFYRLRLQ